MGAAPKNVATAKPSRTRRQPSARPATATQKQRRRDQVAQERTREMAAAAYDRAYRKAQIVLAQQQAKQDAMKDAGVQQQQAPAKPKTPSRKPQNRKPPKR